MPKEGRHMEGRHTIGAAPRVGVRSRLNQSLDRLVVSILCCQVQRVSAQALSGGIHSGVWVCTGPNQGTDSFRMSRMRGHMQYGYTVIAPSVRVRTNQQQCLHNFDVSEPRRDVKGSTVGSSSGRKRVRSSS